MSGMNRIAKRLHWSSKMTLLDLTLLMLTLPLHLAQPHLHLNHPIAKILILHTLQEHIREPYQSLKFTTQLH